MADPLPPRTPHGSGAGSPVPYLLPSLNQLLLEANTEGASWSVDAWRLWFARIVQALTLHTSDTGNRLSAIESEVGSLQRALAASEQAEKESAQCYADAVRILEATRKELRAAESARALAEQQQDTLQAELETVRLKLLALAP